VWKILLPQVPISPDRYGRHGKRKFIMSQRVARYIARQKGQITVPPKRHRVLRDGTTITEARIDEKRGLGTIEGQHPNGSTFSISVPLTALAGIL
jgi:hypothetical protein